jgi:tetratricopeptide (TPR) repeat protein
VEESENVIDARAWLVEHVERLLETDEDRAIPYLERLLVSSEDRGLRIFCLRSLGELYLGRGEIDEARKYLRSASELAPTDPELHHALGQTEASAGRWWLALVEFLEAVFHGRDHEQLSAFMRSVAATMRQLQFGEIALSVLVGAYERAPDDPFILDSLARIYESEDRWLDAIEARDNLLELLESNRALEGSTPPALPEAAREQMHALSQEMRGRLRIAGDEESPDVPSDLLRKNLPSGLHTLIEALGLRDHNLPLLATAEALWARALHEKFDVHLSIPTLAAAIHWIVERMHWRVPTTMAELGRLYGADEERLPAAVRLLVACLELELVPTDEAGLVLTPDQVSRLERLQKALLYDVDLDEVEPRGMLGGGDDG